MVRIVVFFLLIASFVNAVNLDDKIKSFIGEKEYKIQKNLIGILFKDRAKYLRDNNRVDDIKVLEKLKKSGLLKLFYDKPQELNVSFSTSSDALVFMRVINESLASMGYNYFLTREAIKNDDGFVWDIIISTEHILDPLILSKMLESRGCFLESIDRNTQNAWSYKINTSNIRVDAIKVEANRTIRLKKPIRPYWVDVEDMRSISFASKIADRWYPLVIFYDKKLHIVKDYQMNSTTNRLKLSIPKETKYIKIADLYTLDNIKRGISIYLKGR